MTIFARLAAILFCIALTACKEDVVYPYTLLDDAESARLDSWRDRMIDEQDTLNIAATLMQSTSPADQQTLLKAQSDLQNIFALEDTAAADTALQAYLTEWATVEIAAHEIENEIDDAIRAGLAPYYASGKGYENQAWEVIRTDVGAAIDIDIQPLHTAYMMRPNSHNSESRLKRVLQKLRREDAYFVFAEMAYQVDNKRGVVGVGVAIDYAKALFHQDRFSESADVMQPIVTLISNNPDKSFHSIEGPLRYLYAALLQSDQTARLAKVETQILETVRNEFINLTGNDWDYPNGRIVRALEYERMARDLWNLGGHDLAVDLMQEGAALVSDKDYEATRTMNAWLADRE